MTIYDWMFRNLPRPAPLILEIGAHHAEDSEKFFKMFPHARIVAFEPDPRNVPVIRHKRIEQRHKFILVESAIGRTNGVSSFYLSGGVPAGATGDDRNRDWTYSSSVRKPKAHLSIHPSVEFIGETMVSIMTLDNYFGDDRTPIDFIWCDVQGNEADVIEGGRETLARTRYFYTEYDDQELYEGQVGLDRLLASLPDFSAVGRFENNVLLKNIRM
jgi:FkbM family methyltransferase